MAAATSVLRPITYLREGPTRETAAGDLLRRSGASIDDVVLLEDFRESQINQLAPVSTFFISSFSGEPRGLSSGAGTWANQYVPPAFVGEVARREALNAAVFQASDVGAAIHSLARGYRIDYVLTRTRHDFGPGFRLLVDWPGGHLYELLPATR